MVGRLIDCGLSDHSQLDSAQAQLEAAQVELQDKDRAMVVRINRITSSVTNLLQEFINVNTELFPLSPPHRSCKLVQRRRINKLRSWS